MGHEVVPGHHGDLEVQAGLLDDFLYGLSTGQRVHTSCVTDHTDTCNTPGPSLSADHFLFHTSSQKQLTIEENTQKHTEETKTSVFVVFPESDSPFLWMSLMNGARATWTKSGA